ncbi:DUF1828 domain-containing protein [Polymorphobacter fuscus]|uniref:DUF1828 domain-containing protein n=1 Tax=Sandarakinorhabdus fusca TaxID=1439888 RepID=A0A7C9GPI7_9SPHN|nr:DUF1828 domain-containing protein [Polymorphobacter fuscus]KAB7647685.1 DUF1828 domain-containing protein [Polymorphobacter fuscus]MQT16976.1 DUF1828 domain-containing protein [Polymorphobacter fuscus]NJC09034.1 hypothetical protein [Polymorphobacter fuscus]
MKEQLCRAFCDDLTVNDLPMGMAVSTGFMFPDGDRIAFYVREDSTTGLFEVQDSGLVFPGLEASGLDLKNQGRAEAFAALQREYGVTLDEDDREFRLAPVAGGELPHAAMRFVSFLLRVGDLLLLNEDRVASTFRDDVARRLRELAGDRMTITERTEISPELSDFTPDFVLQAPGRSPVGVFLGTSDARVLEALYMQMRAEHETHTAVSIVALLEREKAISAKVRQQANNRLSAVANYRGDELGALGRIVKEALPSVH